MTRRSTAFKTITARARSALRVASVVVLSTGLVGMSILDAIASTNDDHFRGGHGIHSVIPEVDHDHEGHHHIADHRAAHDHDRSHAQHEDDQEPSDPTLCCEDIGICAIGVVLPNLDRESDHPLSVTFKLPAEVAVSPQNLCLPDGPPPRSLT